MKLAAIAEIEETTLKGKQTLDEVVTGQTTALADLQKDYDAILIDWDETKAELDLETKNAIADMKQVMDASSQMSNNHGKINRDLQIKKTNIATLHEDMTTITTKAQTAVNITKDNLVASSINNIPIANNEHLQNMDETFAENMDLMQQQHSSSTSNMEDTTHEAIAKLHSETDICIINISKDIK